MEYIALRSLKVQELDDAGAVKRDDKGRPQIRVVAPGQPCPEAAHWKNLAREVAAGRIGIAGIPLTSNHLIKASRTTAAAQPREDGSPAEPSEGEASEARRRRSKREDA